MKKSIEALFDDTLRPMAVKNQAAELVGDSQTPGTMLYQLTGLMQHIVNYPEVKIKTVLPTAKVDSGNETAYTQLDKNLAFQVNQKALQQVYEMYVVDMDEIDFKLINDEAGRYIQAAYPSPAGLTFVEQWHYFPHHNNYDFTPDAFNVLVITNNFN